MLRFLGPDGRAVLEVGWTGPWPPPDSLRVAVGSLSGEATVVDENLPPELEAELLAAARGTVQITRYRLRSASQLPDDFESEHVFRGAEYVPNLDA